MHIDKGVRFVNFPLEPHGSEENHCIGEKYDFPDENANCVKMEGRTSTKIYLRRSNDCLK